MSRYVAFNGTYVLCESLLQLLFITAVYIPMVIQNQMNFNQFIMLKAFLSATTAGKQLMSLINLL